MIFLFYPEDGGRRFLQNVGNFAPDYTSQKTVIVLYLVSVATRQFSAASNGPVAPAPDERCVWSIGGMITGKEN
jgi:hypothetical protein